MCLARSGHTLLLFWGANVQTHVSTDHTVGMAFCKLRIVKHVTTEIIQALIFVAMFAKLNRLVAVAETLVALQAVAVADHPLTLVTLLF